MQAQATRTTLSIDIETYRRLVKLAHANERTTSAEARVAIRTHLAAQAADRPAGAGPAGGGSTAVDSQSLDGARPGIPVPPAAPASSGQGHEEDR
jgi:hypothetical protein